MLGQNEWEEIKRGIEVSGKVDRKPIPAPSLALTLSCSTQRRSLPLPTSSTALSPARAAAHESLFLKLSALRDQAEKTGIRYPDRAVPPATLAVAETLLAEAAGFVLRRGRRERLPMAAPVWGGLLTQLGQALARLDHFEAQHTRWDKVANARVWVLPGHEVPVRRLRPQLLPRPVDGRRDLREMRRHVSRRLAEIGVAIPVWPARVARKKRRDLSPGETPEA